jgi:amino acid transporter
MSIYLTGILWVIGAAAVGAASGYLVRRFGGKEGREGNNGAAGQVFTIVGGLHAVLMAFVLISLFDSVTVAREGTHQEADSLVAATWAADSLPESTRIQVHDVSRAYAVTVAEQEWPSMREGRAVADTGWAQLDQLRQIVARSVPADDWQAARKADASDQLWQVYQARQVRLAEAGSSGVDQVVWFALILGSLISVLLANLFGGTRLVAHLILVSTLAGTITLLLFAIYELQNPFSGGANIGPDAYTAALARLA